MCDITNAISWPDEDDGSIPQFTFKPIIDKPSASKKKASSKVKSVPDPASLDTSSIDFVPKRKRTKVKAEHLDSDFEGDLDEQFPVTDIPVKIARRKEPNLDNVIAFETGCIEVERIDVKEELTDAQAGNELDGIDLHDHGHVDDNGAPEPEADKSENAFTNHNNVKQEQVTPTKAQNPKKSGVVTKVTVAAKKVPGKEIELECPYCKKYCPKSSLIKHIDMFHDGDRSMKPFKCDSCDFRASTEDNLITHNCFKHYGNEQDGYYCPKCNSQKQFKTAMGLDAHIKRECESKLEALMCDRCGESWPRKFKRKYLEHQRFMICQLDEEPACDKCDFVAKSRSDYVTHVKAKHDDRPVKKVQRKRRREEDNGETLLCHSCTKTFTNSYSLKKHIQNTHEERELEVCDICSRTFVNKSSLKFHRMRDHFGDLPFECEYCHKRFPAKSVLISHQKALHLAHTNCEICGKSMCNSFVKDVHKLGVHGIRSSDPSYSYCNFCPKFFRHVNNLDKHVERVHVGV